MTPRVQECQNFNNIALFCNHTETIPFAYSHIKLPLGWLILYGMKAYSYLPTNAAGGPCTLGWLTVFMPSLERRELQILTSNCDSKTTLITEMEYVALALSLVGVPALVSNARNIDSGMCPHRKSKFNLQSTRCSEQGTETG